MQPLLVIAHRGASGYLPEHTLEAYALAIAQGADFIEPDLVPTRDGVLIARHENELSGTTDVATRRCFADRRTKKVVDGVAVEGWFSEDFTLAEVKTLFARERIPAIRPANAEYDGRYRIPTFIEVLALARDANQCGKSIGVYPETKHPHYFAHEGRHLDGARIARSISQLVLEDLARGQFNEPALVFIQSFEVENLLQLATRMMPRMGVAFPLVQLLGSLDPGAKEAFALPYDVAAHTAAGDDLAAIYPHLHAAFDQSDAPLRYADLASPAGLAWMQRHYAKAVGASKDSILLREAAPVERGRARLTGAVHPWLKDAQRVGLPVHAYTLRAEPEFGAVDVEGRVLTMQDEALMLAALGVQGLFFDQPDLGVAIKRRFAKKSG